MAISDWPAAERPRERLKLQGAASLSDAELLAIFLRTGVKGQTAVDLARALLEQAGGLRKLLDQDEKTFCRARGLGQTKYIMLQATLELGKRYLQERLEKNSAFSNPATVVEYLTAQLRVRSREVFACLYLDHQHRLLHYAELFEGTINASVVYPREVLAMAMQWNAAAVIFAHNHPSGCAKPSAEDLTLTHQLQQVLQLIDIVVLDHVIIGDGQYTSFAEAGLLEDKSCSSHTLLV